MQSFQMFGRFKNRVATFVASGSGGTIGISDSVPPLQQQPFEKKQHAGAEVAVRQCQWLHRDLSCSATKDEKLGLLFTTAFQFPRCCYQFAWNVVPLLEIFGTVV